MPDNAMNKKMYISIGLLAAFVATVFIILIFTDLNSKNNSNNVSPQSETQSSTISDDIAVKSSEKNNETTFYLKLTDNNIYIYKGKGGELYDYADINYETLPDDIKEQLKYGLYITGESGLYEFLQTYSS
ncbi:MAG: hypothetical protein ACLSW1_03810 [Lachnospira sp.]